MRRQLLPAAFILLSLAAHVPAFSQVYSNFSTSTQGWNVVDLPTHSTPSSQFDSDAEGWKVVDVNYSGGPYDEVIGGHAVVHVATGGTSGGYIKMFDPSSYAFFFDAPHSFLGDRTSYISGSLVFSMRSDAGDWAEDSVVAFVGRDTVIVAEIRIPETSWTSYEVVLEASRFQYENMWGDFVNAETFQEVMSDLRALRICGEYGDDVEETTALDAVEFVSPRRKSYDNELGFYMVDWIEQGGHQGGYISIFDPTGNSFFFDAPAAYLGDRSSYVGGVLRFALKSTHQDWDNDSVVLIGTSSSIIAVPITPNPDSDWGIFEIPLEHSRFRYDHSDGVMVSEVDFLNTLADIQTLRIAGEYGARIEETVGLDAVALLPPVPAGVGSQPSSTNGCVSLRGAHPNPFNPMTSVSFTLDSRQPVRIAVLDIKGQHIKHLIAEAYDRGTHTVPWNGTDDSGLAMPSGTYLVRMETPGRVESRKVMLVR